MELLLIRAEPPCRKCHKTEAVLREVAAASPEPLDVRCLAADDPEAARFGAVMTPMVILNGKVVCAGIVPRARGLSKLIENESA